MEEQLKEALAEGETILWKGTAEPYEALDKTHRQHFIIKIAVSLAIALAISIAYVAAAGIANTKFLLIVIVFLIAGITPYNTIADGRRLRKVLYAVSDRRIFTVRDDVKSVEFSQIDCAELKRDPDGHTSLLIGRDGVKSKPTKWRQYTVVGPHLNDGENPVCETFSLYAVNDVPGLRKALAGRLPCLKG